MKRMFDVIINDAPIANESCIVHLDMTGVTIGDGCVIGAHSIVKSSIPEASIAVGSPAKVVKRYSFEQKKWIKVK